MKAIIKTICCLILLPLLACSQTQDEHLKYLEQKTPNLIPEVFAPGIISKNNEYEFGSVFNKEATAFYYGVDVDGKSEIRFTELIKNQWSKPKVILSHENYGFNDPFLSPDEKRLYFISQKALHGRVAKKDYDIWYVERLGNEWSEPINAGPNINSPKDEYYISFTDSGTMYFASNKMKIDQKNNNFDIYKSENNGGEFQQAIILGDSINTKHYEADVFIDPQENYIIFCARRPDGLGRGDLYISFKNTDGTWTKSLNMGDKINTKGHELCPFVSYDGKYFFYTSNEDIYWVSTEIFYEIKEDK